MFFKQYSGWTNFYLWFIFLHILTAQINFGGVSTQDVTWYTSINTFSENIPIICYLSRKNQIWIYGQFRIYECLFTLKNICDKLWYPLLLKENWLLLFKWESSISSFTRNLFLSWDVYSLSHLFFGFNSCIWWSLRIFFLQHEEHDFSLSVIYARI